MFNTGTGYIMACLHMAVSKDSGPFSISYLEAKITWNFPPSHLTIFYLHSKWLGSQVTWQLAKSQVTSIADLEISWAPLTSLFVFCIFLNSYIWQYMVCITCTIYIYIYKWQSTFSSLINHVFDATGYDSIVGFKTGPWVTMVLHSMTSL